MKNLVKFVHSKVPINYTLLQEYYDLSIFLKHMRLQRLLGKKFAIFGKIRNGQTTNGANL